MRRLVELLSPEQMVNPFFQKLVQEDCRVDEENPVCASIREVWDDYIYVDHKFYILFCMGNQKYCRPAEINTNPFEKSCLMHYLTTDDPALKLTLQKLRHILKAGEIYDIVDHYDAKGTEDEIWSDGTYTLIKKYEDSLGYYLVKDLSICKFSKFLQSRKGYHVAQEYYDYYVSLHPDASYNSNPESMHRFRDMFGTPWDLCRVSEDLIVGYFPTFNCWYPIEEDNTALYALGECFSRFYKSNFFCLDSGVLSVLSEDLCVWPHLNREKAWCVKYIARYRKFPDESRHLVPCLNGIHYYVEDGELIICGKVIRDADWDKS